MPELILRFHDDALDAFDWLVLQDGVVTQEVDWRSGSESDLGELMSTHVMPVVFAIPQHCVFMTHFDLPAKASRQILSSIEFQIEDQLGDDIDLQHFATGDIVDNSVPIVVIKKLIMQRCQVLQKKFSMTMSKIIPELFLCPWTGKEGEVSVLEGQDGENSMILRWGHYKGFKCQSTLLKSMLDQLNRGQLSQNRSIEKMVYFYTNGDAYEAVKVDGYESQKTIPDLNHLNDPKIANFDLRQREFKRSSVWIGVIKPWKWVAVICLAFLTIFAYNKSVHLNVLEDQLADIKRSQYELVKAHLPTGTKQSDNLKKELIQLINQNKNSMADKDFLSQLMVFSKAKRKYNSVIITKINFQKSRLSIDINSTKLNDVETLVKTLELSSLAVKLENLTIKTGFIFARLVLGG
ncbi:MAG: type II secretion system protein L [Urechidicola sp.]|jgi:type II secretion system protein L